MRVRKIMMHPADRYALVRVRGICPLRTMFRLVYVELSPTNRQLLSEERDHLPSHSQDLEVPEPIPCP